MPLARALLRPLRTATAHRCLHLLVGGALAAALALPLVAAAEVPPLALGAPLALLLASALPAVRVLERAQADALLGTALPPAPPPGGGAPRTAVAWGVAAWLAQRAVVGAVGSAALVAGALAAGTSVLAPFAEGFFAWGTWRSPSGPGAAWLPVAGGAALLGALHVADGLGALQARLAPRLLGTTPGEELAALRAGAEAAAERERVARELHDGVGHAVTVTLLQARAARRVLDADPEAARRSLAAIEAVSRTTMEELDRVLGLLREEAGDEPAGQPAAFDELARSLRAAGLPFELVRHGDLDALPAPVRAAAHRIVQEAATNVLRHAGAAPTRAELVVRDGRLEVCVHNVAGPRAPARTGGGRGLRGVRERALALGGSAASGPSADGGWTVRATLPSEAP